MKRSMILFAAAAMVAVMASPVGAITRGGEPDGDVHPYVGLMVADDEFGNALWRCSGALISPTVYVTAGHCTEPPAAGARVYFEEYEVDIRAAGYPFLGGVPGKTHTHPDYDPAAFFLWDLGVVVLDDPVYLPMYASLPEVGAIDEMPRGRKNNMITAVGYGLQEIIEGNPFDPGTIKLQADLDRLKADLMIVNTKGVFGLGPVFEQLPGTGSITVSSDAKHGGTCFGDSGGPQLINGHTIAAVTSFGVNGNCKAPGGAYRIDQQDDLDFINSFGS